MSEMVPTLPSPIPYRPRSHPIMIPAAEPATVDAVWNDTLNRWVRRCHACLNTVGANHVPNGDECQEDRHERDISRSQ